MEPLLIRVVTGTEHFPFGHVNWPKEAAHLPHLSTLRHLRRSEHAETGWIGTETPETC